MPGQQKQYFHPNTYNTLTVQDLLGNNGSQTTQQMGATVYNNNLLEHSVRPNLGVRGGAEEPVSKQPLTDDLSEYG